MILSVLKNSASSTEGKTAYPILPPVHANVFENPLEIIVLSEIDGIEDIEICEEVQKGLKCDKYLGGKLVPKYEHFISI